jgi:hypothetical protein
MPASKYSERPKIYECQQYDGTNFADLAAWAPLVQEEGKVYLNSAMGKLEVLVGSWVMKDNFDLFSAISDALFQKGYKPGGGP